MMGKKQNPNQCWTLLQCQNRFTYNRFYHVFTLNLILLLGSLFVSIWPLFQEIRGFSGISNCWDESIFKRADRNKTIRVAEENELKKL